MDLKHISLHSLSAVFFSLCVLKSFVQPYQQPRVDKYSIEVNGSAVIIHINESLPHDDKSYYQIDYTPGFGEPPPNTTFKTESIDRFIRISNLYSGTSYKFKLYYFNSSHHRLLFSAPVNTYPDPPNDLQVSVINGTNALLKYFPPKTSGYSHLYLKVTKLPENDRLLERVLPVASNRYTLKGLTPGQSYRVQLSTFFMGKESTTFKEEIFTTKPNPPAKFIAWDRNETTLKVLVSPPSSDSIYSQFKVSILPEDAPKSVQYIMKKDQFNAVFNNLVPGKLYKISVQTVSNNTLSATISQVYKTLPCPPSKFSVQPSSITTSSFAVTWEPPAEQTEFDKYQISIDLNNSNPVTPIIKNKTEMRIVKYTEHLLPGRTYRLNATTVSGKVSSREVSINATLCPLSISYLNAKLDEKGLAKIKWRPNNASYQDSYQIIYSEVQNGDSNLIATNNTEYVLESLLPGRNYSISIKSVSKNITSSPRVVYLATRPSSPNIEDLIMLEYGLNISWKSDVDSHQDMYGLSVSSDKIIKNYTTKETYYLLKDMYPGAKYHIEIYAVSHGLKSHPHLLTQVIYPKPPVNGSKKITLRKSLIMAWDRPTKSLYSGFSLRYKTKEGLKWTNHTVKEPKFEIHDLITGESYLFEIFTISYGIFSHRPLCLNYTLNPSPLADIDPQVASTNITLEFPRPEGRIEYYVIEWVSQDDIRKNYTIITEAKRNSTDEKRVKIIVEKLLPGARYEFHVFTKSHGLYSSRKIFSRQTVPVIQSTLKTQIIPEDRKRLTVEYTPTFLSDSLFDKYRFNLSAAGIMVEKASNDSERKVSFGNLVPGKLYTVIAWTISGRMLSKPIYKQERLFPDPVSELIIKNVTDHSFALKWNKPLCEVNSYEVQTFCEGKLVSKNITPVESFNILNLKPFTNYSVKVVVQSGTESSLLRRSSPCSIDLQTNEGLPGMVTEFKTVYIQPREITFDWKLPSFAMNGNITKFTITCRREESSDVRTLNISSIERRTSIKELLPGIKYTFSIKAATNVGYGPAASVTETMPILAPPKPSSHAVPQEIFHTGTTIHIRFEKDYFSNENGQIKAFTIIVAEDDKKNTSTVEMLSWRDVQSYSLWPPYQVVEPYYPFENSRIEDFVIGTEKGCKEKKTGYCNGPLKEGAVYKVKIRAFTTDVEFTDTEYSSPIQTDQNQISLLIAFLLPALFLLSLIFGNIIIRKCRKPSGSENIPFEECSFQEEIMPCKPIKVDRFKENYRTMSSNRNRRFSEEFEKLEEVGRGQLCNSGNDYFNRAKNRFTNILPFDHSRVRLEPISALPGSDYINASYIPGYNSVNEYIATQGPLFSTRDDFWRMCWETNSRAIVMLTRCVEEGREKCDHYWPEDNEAVNYGSIIVKIIDQQCHPDWCITELKVTRGTAERTMTHFHFTSWPVFGVPNSPLLLVKFAKTFREKIKSEPRPIVVHCSAGVGRSGTFIAVDQVIQALARGEEFIDVFGLVYRMRKERMLMVQTVEQYITIHKCVLALLQKSVDLHERIYQNLGFDDDEGIAETGI